MPLYNLACRRALDDPARERVAQAVTRAHCDVTGAPAEFVNVMFAHGYPLAGSHAISALGGVRSGGTRTQAVVDALRDALRRGIAQAAGLKDEQVEVTLIGVPSSWVMEGGRVMPEPGAEKEWLAQN